MKPPLRKLTKKKVWNLHTIAILKSMLKKYKKQNIRTKIIPVEGYISNSILSFVQ